MFEVVAEGIADETGEVTWEWFDEGGFCSLCDAVPDHGAAGCPLENRGYDDGFDQWERSRGVW